MEVPEKELTDVLDTLKAFIAIVPSEFVFEATRQGYIQVDTIWDTNLGMHFIMSRPDAAKNHAVSLGVSWPD